MREEIHPTVARRYRDLSARHQNRSPGLWRLPPEYAFAHDYCFFLNDTLGHLIRDAQAAGALSVTFDLTRLPPEVRAELVDGDLEGEALATWLEEHGYQDIVNDLTERHVIAAVVSDAAQFIYEALRCSEKGKLVVTFALLRKPLRENLLLLELLLADRDRFLQLFATNNQELGIYSLPKSTRALPIIEAVVRAIGRQEMLDPAFLYEIRYADHQHFSMEAVWGKATHLITTNRHFATEPNNLNFVFSGEDEHKAQWDELYRKLPFLLFYFVEVASALIKRIVGAENFLDMSLRKREMGLSLTTYLRKPIRPLNESPLSHMKLDCPLCHGPVLDTIDSLADLFMKSATRCPTCGVLLDLTGHVAPAWTVTLRVWTLPVRRLLNTVGAALRGKGHRPDRPVESERADY